MPVGPELVAEDRVLDVEIELVRLGGLPGVDQWCCFLSPFLAFMPIMWAFIAAPGLGELSNRASAAVRAAAVLALRCSGVARDHRL